ncbi:hypothetical protein GCM10010345_84300 [Streptomyces canarius]|uniref:Aminoglycoside phosphotransferase domain-containing protein n=1 Tax=Streptomyces canarius TaxID=285453 RepID=A0ABQ3D931_9ACTN|nr:hypothetical protein GCM10010345_84300 [Streptomyces canarius]
MGADPSKPPAGRAHTSLEGLAEEHAFLRHLRRHGALVVLVLDTAERGEWAYEVHSAGVGMDLYRDALSWSPFRSAVHAHAAGEALSRLHLAAEGFDTPRRRVQPLVASFTVFASSEPLLALEGHVAERRGLAEALRHFPWREDTERVLVPLHERLSPHLDGLAPLWTHNDWHASNLLWDADGQVATVLDFGMSDRTTAVHDLATAIERNAVQWLQPGYPVREEYAVALLEGYRSVRPLTADETAALPALLPLDTRSSRLPSSAISTASHARRTTPAWPTSTTSATRSGSPAPTASVSCGDLRKDERAHRHGRPARYRRDHPRPSPDGPDRCGAPEGGHHRAGDRPLRTGTAPPSARWVTSSDTPWPRSICAGTDPDRGVGEPAERDA